MAFPDAQFREIEMVVGSSYTSDLNWLCVEEPNMKTVNGNLLFLRYRLAKQSGLMLQHTSHLDYQTLLLQLVLPGCLNISQQIMIIIVIGALNFDLPRNTSKNLIALRNILDSFDLVNLVKDPSCLRQSPPTNKLKSFQRTTTIADGISEFHSTVCTTKKMLHCRSYTNITKNDFFERPKLQWHKFS